MIRKNIYQFLNRNKEYIVVYFFLFLLFSAKDIVSQCKLYLETGFDHQALFTWDYASLINLAPYKHIFYPYGLFYYMKDKYLLLHIFYFLTFPLLVLAIFCFLKKVWQNHVFAYVSFFTFVLYIWRFIDIDTFYRYGIITVLGSIYAWMLSKKLLNRKSLFLFGFVNGLIFSLITDQGTYGITLFITLLVVVSIIEKGRKTFYRKYLLGFLKQFIYFALGILIGILPFSIYLFVEGNIIHFLTAFLNLKDLFFYAKTPFFNNVRSPENLFTIVILLCAILHISYRFFHKKSTLSFNYYFQISLVIILLLLEQKSIIRSMPMQITFISLLLLYTLLGDLVAFLKKFNMGVFYLAICFILLQVTIFIVIGLKPIKPFYVYEAINANSCIQQNIANFESKNKDYKKVKDYIYGQKESKQNIFSYPGDPIFYIMFHQIPPYYFSTYEASPLYAQNRLVKYMKNQKTQYVIYNYKNFAIQDEVPNYIRTPFLHEYILNNFSPAKKIGTFLILNRIKENEDLFKDKVDVIPSDFKQQLLNIDLKNIPRSEGYYKKNYLFSNENKRIIDTSSIEKFNAYLKKNTVNTHQKFLVVSFAKNAEIKEDVSLKIKTRDNLSSDVHFYRCGNGFPCIINLSHIPLFYKNRVFQEISINASEIQSIALFEISKNSYFW